LANPLVEFNDSQLGVVLGSVLHTLGAIAFLGGLVGYIAWHRHLALGHHHRKVLDASAFLTYLAIVVNLLGGFMRTYQTGHPHITQFAESPWVRAIVIKHGFLFLAQGFAVYLFEVVAPRLLRAHKAGTLADPNPLGHRIGVAVVAFGIVLAAILGALTQVVPLVSADAPIDDTHGDMAGMTAYHNATGQLTSSPVRPGQSSGSFVVPNGTHQLRAILEWTPTQYDLDLLLTAPSGAQTAEAGSQGTLEAQVDAPEVGTWTYTITSDLAVDAAWTLSVSLSMAEDAEHDHAAMAFLAGPSIPTRDYRAFDVAARGSVPA
jgi:hypothetical protein